MVSKAFQIAGQLGSMSNTPKDYIDAVDANRRLLQIGEGEFSGGVSVLDIPVPDDADELLVQLTGVKSGTATAEVFCRASMDGSTFLTNNYWGGWRGTDSASNTYAFGINNASRFPVTHTGQLQDNTLSRVLETQIRVSGFTNLSKVTFASECVYQLGNGNIMVGEAHGMVNDTTTPQIIRVGTTDEFLQGSYSVYKRKLTT